MSPQFVVSPSDLQNAVGALQGIGNPLRMAARLAGLGDNEWRAGVPAWAWMALAFGAGVYIGVAHVPAIQEKLGLS